MRWCSIAEAKHLLQVTEQILTALGMNTCSDIIAKRGLVSALFKPLSVDFFIKAGLGFGQARVPSCQCAS